MDELLKVKKQIEDLQTYHRAPKSVDDIGWHAALDALETYVTSRISALNRNSDVRPY